MTDSTSILECLVFGQGLDSSSPPTIDAAPEDLVRAAKGVTLAVTKTVTAGNSALLEDVTVAADLGNRAVSKMLITCKVLLYSGLACIRLCFRSSIDAGCTNNSCLPPICFSVSPCRGFGFPSLPSMSRFVCWPTVCFMVQRPILSVFLPRVSLPPLVVRSFCSLL